MNGYAIGRKDTLDFTHYVRGKQVVPLPEELKRTFKVIIIAYFDTFKKATDFGTLNRNGTSIGTYHTHGTHTCLGDDKRPFQDISPDDPLKIHKALDQVKETVQILNPYSPLSGLNDITRNLRPTIRYVQEQRSIADNERNEMRNARARRQREERNRNRETAICNHCGEEYYTDESSWTGYCSTDCVVESGVGNDCLHCNNTYLIDESNANDPDNFCCEDCESTDEWETEEFECQRCRRIYRRVDSDADEEEVYCSNECLQEHAREREQRAIRQHQQQQNNQQPRNSAIAGIMNEANNNTNNRGWRVNGR